ncbi:MAG: hypothetical protein WCA35_22840 [Kovacikia sp.]
MLTQTEARRLIDVANTRLGRSGLKLEVSGKNLNISVRGMFPARPGDNRQGTFQTRLSLKQRAIDKEVIKQAENTAREIALDLNRGTFDWRRFSDYQDPDQKTIDAWVKEYEQQWWRSKDRSDPSKQSTWLVYEGILKKLPREGALTLEGLVDWVIDYSEPNTVMRRHYCTVSKGLASLARFPTESIKTLVGEQPSAPVNPRSLPTDSEIVETRNSITDPGWQYIFGLICTYGLRNHEVWWLDYSEFPIVRVREGTKTGSRPCYPYYPEWAELWELDKAVYPTQIELAKGQSNKKLGSKVTRWFLRILDRSPYDYRHCFARRCLEFGLTVDVAARLMGHSELVHKQTYRAWIGDKTYLDAAEKAAKREDRPRSPRLNPENQVDT